MCDESLPISFCLKVGFRSKIRSSLDAKRDSELRKVGSYLSDKYYSEDVGVVVLDYNKPDLTQGCIEAIKNFNDLKIYLVNNGNSYRDSRSRFSCHRIIENEYNLGFSAGMNAGIKAAVKDGCRYVVLLNNDARVTKSAIRKMIVCLERMQNVGLVAPNKSYSSGLLSRQTTHESGEQAPDSCNGTDDPNWIKPVNKIMGFCMATRIDVLSKAGLLDEDFFFGREDDEWSLRIESRGYSLAEITDSIVFHFVSSTTDFKSTLSMSFLSYNMSRGRALLARKAYSSVTTQLFHTLWDSVLLELKGMLISKRFHVEIITSALKGFNNGLHSEIKPPFTINQ